MSDINWDEAPDGDVRFFNDVWIRNNNGIIEFYSGVGKWFAIEDQLNAINTWNIAKQRDSANKDDSLTGRVSSNKYERELTDRYSNTCHVDVYDVLLAFEVTCPAIQHAIKKLLCTGIRGHKDSAQDLLEAKESITRAIELATKS